MQQKKKVLILTYYWPPSGGAGVQRWLKFTKYLSDYGIDPIILTVDENYAEYPVLDTNLVKEQEELNVYKTKTWEPFSIYKKLSGNKTVKAGESNTSSGSKKTKLFNFIRGNLFIPDPRKYWKKYALTQAFELIDKHKIDTLITTGPPHSVHLIGLAIKKKKNIKWIADFRDPWSNFMFNEQLNRTVLAKKLDSKYEQQVLKNSDKIIAATNGIAKDFKAFSYKTITITNGYDSKDFPDRKIKAKQKFTISYIGNFRENQNISIFWKVLNENIKSGRFNNENFELNLVGNVCNEVKSVIHDSDLKSVTNLQGYLPHNEAINEMLNSHLLLIIIPNVSSKNSILTGKIFEYLATQIPILTIGPTQGDASILLKENKRNIAIAYNDEKGLHNFILSAFNQWEKSGEINYVNNDLYLNYTRKNLAEKIANLI